MNWFSINLYYQLGSQAYVLKKVQAFLCMLDFTDFSYCYSLGFDDIYYVRLSFDCNAETKLVLISRLDKFLKDDKLLKRYKSKVMPHFSEHVGAIPRELSDKISILSSKTALKLMFYEDNGSSYFHLLFNAIIFNYLVARVFVSSADLTTFFKFYLQAAHLNEHTSLYDFRFEMSKMRDAIECIDLRSVLYLADMGELDICDLVKEFILEMEIIEKSMLSESVLVGAANTHPLGQIPTQVSRYEFLVQILQMNNNRMCILDSDSEFCINLMLGALN